ncbi:MAG: hypothetical protein JW909_10790 [Planctomycetes bacterium]|nr:hypothetical protein [Planctomycetota bacterium]
MEVPEEVLSRLGGNEPVGTERARVFRALADLGFEAPAACRRNLTVLHGHLGREENRTRRVMGVILDAAGPDLALSGLAALTGELDGDGLDWLLGLPEGDLAALAEVFSLSGSLGELAVMHAGELRELVGAGGLAGPATAEAGLPEGISIRGAAQEIARRKRTELFRTAALDLAGRIRLEDVLERLSAAAEGAVADAVAAAARNTGVPAESIAVLGMGKLGGGELNYSSDIDLVFVQGEGAAGEKAKDLAEAVVAVLETDTAWGRPARVDLRLRPEGSSGRLVPTARYMRKYYKDRAAAWEYQAMIRSNVIAGSRESGGKLVDWMRELVFGREYPAEVLRSLVLMRRRNEGPQGHVKQRRGGIRDVEFTVQWLQMAEGARHPGVRARSTLDAIGALAAAGALEDGDAETLAGAYRFLRALEHRLQLAQELQTFVLPASESGRRLLARSMGLKDAGALEEAFQRHTDGVAETAGRVMAARGANVPTAAPARRTAEAKEALAGLTQPVRREIERLAEHYGFDADGPAGVLAMPVAREEYIKRLERVLGQEGFPLELVKKGRVGELLRLIGYSGHFYERMLADPEMAEGILGNGTGMEELRAAVKRSIAAAGLEDLARARTRALCRVAAVDLDGSREQDVPGLIAEVNETVIRRLLEAKGLGDRLEVYALGRLGGREGSYGSDADLLFIAPDAAAAGEMEPAVQEMLRFLNREVGLETDERLRPEGSRGVLVPTAEAFTNYVSGGGMKTWEFMAVWGRMRGVSRSAVRMEEVRRRHLLANMPAAEELFAEAARMRRRQAEAYPAEDLKKGRGGTGDIEMLVYALACAGGQSCGNIPEAIARLHAEGTLTLSRAATACSGYVFLSKIERTLRLARPDLPGILPGVEERRGVALAAGYREGRRKSAARLLSEDVDYYRQEVSGLFRAMTSGE